MGGEGLEADSLPLPACIPFEATNQHRTRLEPLLRGKLLPEGLSLLLFSDRGRMFGLNA